jgi:lysophospholipase L1-like esterase
MNIIASDEFARGIVVLFAALAVFGAGMFSYPFARDVYQNIRGKSSIGQNYTFHNALSAPFEIHGFAFLGQNDGKLNRLVAGKRYSDGIDKYAKHTAGGRIAFCTNSPTIAIKAKLSDMITMPYHTVYGSAGMDVYAQTDGRKRWIATVAPQNNSGRIFATITARYIQYVITLPQYASVDEINIGVESGCAITPPIYDYGAKKPIVFYGSSITHGAAAGRAGTSFPFLVADYFNADYLNFGFSGSAKGEQSAADEIAALEMRAFVMEYDHNAETAADLEATHYDFYKTIRDSHPNIPIVMMSRISGGYSCSAEEAEQRRGVVRKTYEKATADGDNNAYFIDGAALMDGLDASQYLADGKHPNDAGMRAIADAIVGVLKNTI